MKGSQAVCMKLKKTEARALGNQPLENGLGARGSLRRFVQIMLLYYTNESECLLCTGCRCLFYFYSFIAAILSGWTFPEILVWKCEKSSEFQKEFPKENKHGQRFSS